MGNSCGGNVGRVRISLHLDPGRNGRIYRRGPEGLSLPALNRTGRLLEREAELEALDGRLSAPRQARAGW